MLGRRIVTAVVLLALLLPALFASRPEPFALLTLVFIAAAAWEWASLNGAAGTIRWALAGVVVALCLVSWTGHWASAWAAPGWTAAALAWAAWGPLALHRGVGGWAARPRRARLAMALPCLWLSWLALVEAHGIGLNFLLSVLCLVWVSDTAAYAAGHLFGRRKLAPAISPGKTWEGALGGLLGVWLLGLLWIFVVDARLPVDGPGLFSSLVRQMGWLAAAWACAGLVALGIMGDLFESLLKRAAGVKDSSGLLPGHGGVLDRIDALLPVFPAAMALVAWGGSR